jgi:hypothetical protein
MTHWLWYLAGIGTVVAALMFAGLVSRLFREPAAHRAGIDEDEDDPEPELRIDPSLYPKGRPPTPLERLVALNMSDRPPDLGPPPTYPETPDPVACADSSLLAFGTSLLQEPPETPAPPRTPERDGAGTELAGGDAETRTRPADESHPPR